MKNLTGSFNYLGLLAPDFKKRWKFYLIAIAALMAMSGISYAQEAGQFAILDKIDAAFKPFQTTWHTAIKGYAVDLFWKLALIDFMWSAVVWVMEKQDLSELTFGLVRKIFTLGFFFSLLKFSDTWIPAIIDSLRSIGENVGGVKATPDGIMFVGYEIAIGMFELLNTLGFSEKVALALPIAAMAIFIFLAFVFVAGVLLITIVESYIAIGAGVILLGFGGSRWTTEFATKYLQFAFGTGMKLMVIYLVVGAGQVIVNGMTIDPDNLIQSILVMLGTVFIYAYLVIQIPAIVSGMMAGSPALSASGLATTSIAMGAAALGGASMAQSALSSGASGLSSGAAGATGLGKALGAGLGAAHDLGKSGMGAASHAVGEVASQGIGMASGAIGSAVGGAGSSFADKVAGSTGSQIASNIDNSRGGSMSGGSSSGGGGSSAGGGSSSGGGGSSAGGGSSSGGGGGGDNPVMPTNSTFSGDASSASISGSAPESPASPGQQSTSLADRVKGLEGYVPPDESSGGGSIQINMSHAKD